MLTIRNLDNIVGHFVYSKWLSKSKDWVVREVEAVGDTYIFEMMNTNPNARFSKAEIQLRREPMWDKVAEETVYELWAWNLENNRAEILTRRISDMRTVRDMGLWLAMIIDKIVPTK